MTAKSNGIASWEENFQLPKDRFVEDAGSGITTEAEPEENPVWDKIYNALLDLGVNAQSNAIQDGDHPNGMAISTALSWISFLRKQHPVDPPTCVIPEPSGGIIIERRARCRAGHDYLYELTFYNDGSAESTVYFDGRVVSMNPIPANSAGLVG